MTMRLCLVIAAGCLCLASEQGFAQQSTAPSTATPPAPVLAKPIPADVRAAVERMARAMKAQAGLELRADLIEEEVLDDGMKIQSSSTMTASARRPDRLFIEIASARRNRQFYYDGKMMTLYGPVQKYYASIPAPPTTAAMLDEVADRYGLVTPLLDIFEWGVAGVKLDKVTNALSAGPDRIGNKTCDQYAFRQQGVDWQIWIPKEEPALPCKLVIVSTVDPSQPALSAIFTWTPNDRLGDDRFTFTPPPGARRIALENANVPTQQKATGQ